MATHSMDLQDAEGHLRDLAKLVLKGEQVLINLGDDKFMKLTLEGRALSDRVAGLHEGQGWVSDDFDEPMDDLFGLGENT